MRCVDLFCGCGGLSRGFKNAGYTIVAAMDNWPAASLCYKQNFSHPFFNINLHNWQEAVKLIQPLNCDIIIGGPPCQDFSHAGNRKEGERAQLTVSYAKIVAAIKPQFFVMENVDRAQLSDAYKEAKDILVKAGYGLTEKTLNASYCGVPQNRKRFFCIGLLNGQDGFLDGILAANLSDLPLTVKEYCGNEIEITHYYRHPRTYGRRAIFSVTEPAPTIRGCNRPMPPEYKRHPKDAIDPKLGVRALTTRERALIQTFPNDYSWLDSSSLNDQLIGNAVPVKLGEYIARAIIDFSKGTYNISDVGFVDWLKVSKGYTPRAASDVLSRVRRIKRLFAKNGIDSYTDELSALQNIEEFSLLTKSVKSQLRRAYALHNEYNSLTK